MNRVASWACPSFAGATTRVATRSTTSLLKPGVIAVGDSDSAVGTASAAVGSSKRGAETTGSGDTTTDGNEAGGDNVSVGAAIESVPIVGSQLRTPQVGQGRPARAPSTTIPPAATRARHAVH